MRLPRGAPRPSGGGLRIVRGRDHQRVVHRRVHDRQPARGAQRVVLVFLDQTQRMPRPLQERLGCVPVPFIERALARFQHHARREREGLRRWLEPALPGGGLFRRCGHGGRRRRQQQGQDEKKASGACGQAAPRAGPGP